MPQARAKHTCVATFALVFLIQYVRGWGVSCNTIRSAQVPFLRCRSHSWRVTSSQRRLVPMCELERLPRRTLNRVVTLRPTFEKWLAHYGQTTIERQHRLVNGLGTAFVLYWIAFFASRTLLGPFTWRISSILVFLQAFIWPILESHRHTLDLWGEGGKLARRRTRGALFTGRVTRTGFALASEASNHRTHFQMLVEDEEGRELFFDVPQVPGYRSVRRGMRCQVVVLSRSPGFSKLTGVTDAYLPELDMFVGRYPLLNKSAFWGLLHARNKRDMYESDAIHASRVRENQQESPRKTARDRPGPLVYTKYEQFGNRFPVHQKAWQSSRDQMHSEGGSRI